MIDQLVTSILFDLAQALGHGKSMEGFEAMTSFDDKDVLQALGTVSKKFVQHAVVHDESAATKALENCLLTFLTTTLRDALYSDAVDALPEQTKATMISMKAIYSEGQIAYACAELAHAIGKTKVALIQSPMLLSATDKQHMIADLPGSQPLFPLFVVRRELVGGMRVLLGDPLFDDTFHTQLQRLFTAVS